MTLSKTRLPKMKLAKTKLKQLSSLGVLAASLLLFVGCGSPTGTTPTNTTATSPAASPAATTDAKELKNIRVQLPFLFQSVDAPIVLAIKKGYFAEEGLNVTYERGFGNVDTISKLGTGKFDLAFSDMYNALEFNDKNPNDKIVAVAVPFNRAPFAVLTLKEKGIKDPKELAGKTLGAPAGDGPRKLFPLFAEEIGVDPASVNWTTMEPKLRETFLLQGKVDAISGFSTSALPSLIKGGKKMEDINVFYYTDYGLNFYGNGILAKADFVDKNPEVVKGFVRAYLRAMQDMLKNPEEAVAAVLEADESKLMDKNAETVRLKVAIEQLIITPEAESLGLGAIDPKRMETTIQQTTAGFKLKGKPTLADIFKDGFLPPKEERAIPPASERKPLS